MKNTKTLAHTALKPLIDYRNENRGAVTDITNRYNAGLDAQVSRTTIERWLHPEPDKRTEPLFGAGLRLIEVWHNIERELIDAATGTVPHAFNFNFRAGIAVGYCSCEKWKAERDTNKPRYADMDRAAAKEDLKRQHALHLKLHQKPKATPC